MRRLAAAIIDFYVCGFIIMFVIMVLSIITGGPLSYFINIFIVINFGYTFIFDYFFKGNSVGKRCMKIDIIIPPKGKLKYSILHGLLKILITILWPLCALIYFIMGFKMPYDKYMMNIY
ncbi:RDD family protein [Lacrimispora brassicae]